MRHAIRVNQILEGIKSSI